MSADANLFRALLGRMIADAWQGETIATRLRQDPLEVLAEYGLHPPPGRRIAVHFDTDAIQHIIADPGWAQRYGQDIFRKLAEDPKATLQKLGLPVKDGVEYRVLSNTMNSMNIVIPRKPSRHECSVQHLR